MSAQAGDAALFFGLSGTGKTTLSADPERGLIGDDEHGWSDDGVFNFEGGCYAKVIDLSAAAEPEIYATHAAASARFSRTSSSIRSPARSIWTTSRSPRTRGPRIRWSSSATRLPEKSGGQPKNIILLTCDASGVMPPIARLTPDQALYQFICGYTAKLAGTEAGLRRRAGDHVQRLLRRAVHGASSVRSMPSCCKHKIQRYGVNCWLVNTGWVGGPYGVGKRISIKHTRALLNAALDGKLQDVEYRTDPIFGYQIPTSCPDVPAQVLNPGESWSDPKAWLDRYRQLAGRFRDNFKKFEAGCPPEVIAAGPQLTERAEQTVRA